MSTKATKRVTFATDTKPSPDMSSCHTIPFTTEMEYSWSGGQRKGMFGSSQNNSLILIGAVLVLMYIYVTNNKIARSASSLPNAARAVSSMLTRIVSGRAASVDAPPSAVKKKGPLAKALKEKSLTIPAATKDLPSEKPNATQADKDEEVKQALSTCAPHTFIFVWATWCGHCHDAMPTVSEVIKKLKTEHNVDAIAIDGSQVSDSVVQDTLHVRGYPTMMSTSEDGKRSEINVDPRSGNAVEAMCARVLESDQTFHMFY